MQPQIILDFNQNNPSLQLQNDHQNANISPSQVILKGEVLAFSKDEPAVGSIQSAS
jgi:hypothetical protein